MQIYDFKLELPILLGNGYFTNLILSCVKMRMHFLINFLTVVVICFDEPIIFFGFVFGFLVTRDIYNLNNMNI